MSTGHWTRVRVSLLAGLLLATGASLSASDLPSDPGVAASLARYLESRSARFIDWLPDGSMIVATRFGETEQIHRLRSPLSMREQLSFEPGGVIAAAAEPEHGDAFVYLSPRMGGQSTALLLRRAAGQAAVALTDGSFRDGAALWAHDGTRIVFSSNRAAGTAGRERDLELLDTSVPGTPLRVLATGTGWRWRALDWSLDDRHLLLARESVGLDAEPELFLADVATAELTPLALPRKPDSKGPAPAPTPLRARAARFAPDGRGLLLLTAEGAGTDFLQLRYLDPVGGEARLLSVDTEHDIELFDESADGRFLAYTSNEGGSSHLTLVDQQRKLDLNPGSVPPGIISSLKFDSTGKRLALTLESARAPRDVYVLEPETQALTRWSASELGPIDAANLVMPALVHFPTWDRIDGQARMLSAYAYRPAGAATASPAARPVLILLRSGARRQFRPGYDPFVQYLVNELGFVVLAPNVRGASGFGHGFGELGQGALRDDAARDVGSLLVWIGLQHELDHNRVMLMGEGYGSYLALSCLGQYGDRLRGGIAAFPPHLEPLANLAAIRQPVLIVHGRSDPDAPAYEAEQLAARLRVNGAQVQYLGAADEAGEFLRKSNRDAYYSAAANFLTQLLR
jgi:dipeptidyl aminopeptidase/acylaminoacyl peptidase